MTPVDPTQHTANSGTGPAGDVSVTETTPPRAAARPAEVATATDQALVKMIIAQSIIDNLQRVAIVDLDQEENREHRPIRCVAVPGIFDVGEFPH